MANWKEIYDRAEDMELERLCKRAERRKAAQAQQPQQTASQDTTDAAQNTHVQWYEILIQDKFVDFFKPHNMEVFRTTNGKGIFHPVFEEFRGIVLGMTSACSVGDWNRKEIGESLARSNPHEAVGYNHFLDTCPGGQGRFAEVWQTIQDPYETDVESLSAEQVAVLILYPFWSRIGGNFEIEFAQDGRLGMYLRTLKKQILDGSEKRTPIKHMSYLEAHKIIHDYIDVVVRSGQYENVPFYRESAFKNSKEEIICAFKLFFAVGYRYGGNLYSEEEWEAFKLLFSSVMSPWMKDELVDEYIKCEEILNNKTLWGRIKYRKATPYIKDKRNRLTEEWHKEFLRNDCGKFREEQDDFYKAIKKLAQESEKKAKESPNDLGNAERYCLDVYEYIGLLPRQLDLYMFWPIPTLQKFANAPEMGEYFTEEQKEYVFLFQK